jgi:hypothetical protein
MDRGTEGDMRVSNPLLTPAGWLVLGLPWLDKTSDGWGECALTPTQKAHAILCDASREGIRLYYSSGDVEHVTPQIRRDVHDGIITNLERDWPPYIQGRIDRGALRTS